MCKLISLVVCANITKGCLNRVTNLTYSHNDFKLYILRQNTRQHKPTGVSGRLKELKSTLTRSGLLSIVRVKRLFAKMTKNRSKVKSVR